MVDLEELKRRQTMTFEEAEGLVEAPTQFRDGNLTREFRNRLWTLFFALFSKCRRDSDGYTPYEIRPPLHGILFRELLNHRHVPIDEIPLKFEYGRELDQFISGYKEIILNQDAKLTLGFIQWVLRDRECPNNLIEAIDKLFSELPGPYSFFVDTLTIMPVSSEVEREAVGQALKEVNESELSGAKSHLQVASQALSDARFSDAVRDSVHAIESAASQIIGKKSTLSSALKVLEKDKKLHPALKQAFDKLYGYAGDEEGVRHAKIDGDTEKVDQPEALFIFSTCAAFVSYLNRKYMTGAGSSTSST